VRILFLSAPHSFEAFEENLEVVTEEFGVHPPLGLAVAAASARDAGHEVQLLDGFGEHLTAEQAAERARRFGPDLIALRLHSTYRFWQDMEYLRPIRRATGAPVLAGGYHLGCYPQESMACKEIDIGFIGDVVPHFPHLLEHLAKDPQAPPPRNMPGVVFRNRKGEVKLRPPEQNGATLDELPFAAREYLVKEPYFNFASQRKPFTIMVTTQGCPYRCVFCVMGLERYRERSVDSVLAEVDECVNRHGMREIDFFDPTFSANRRRTIDLCDALAERRYDLQWACRTRVDCVDPELLRKMRDAGCRRVYLGIENVSPAILDLIKKDISGDQAAQAIKWSLEAGIHPLGFFMIGNPGDTPETIRDMVKWAKATKLDYVQFSRTIAKPMTELHRELIRSTGRDYWADFVLGEVPAQELPRPWCDMSDEDIERWTNWAYRSFYFRPYIVWRRLVNLKSADEFVRYVKVALEMASRTVFRKAISMNSRGG